MLQHDGSWKYYVKWKKIGPQKITSLFTVAKIWKKLKCPAADEWIKKML